MTSSSDSVSCLLGTRSVQSGSTKKEPLVCQHGPAEGESPAMTEGDAANGDLMPSNRMLLGRWRELQSKGGRP